MQPLSWLFIVVVLLAQPCLAQKSNDSASWKEVQPGQEATGSGAAQEDTQPPPTPQLKGAIEHVEVMPPVDERLRPGATFDENLLPTQEPNNQWYKIPEWFAGTWQTEEQTTVAVYDYAAGTKTKTRRRQMAKAQDFKGFQRDRKGNIWQFASAPFTNRVEGDDHISVQIVRVFEPLEVTEDTVVQRFVGTTIRVSKLSGKIMDVSQDESIQTYYPVQPGIVRCNGSLKTFGPDGKPISLHKVVAYSTKVANFTPTNTYNGHDMKRLFKEFLFSRGMTYLCP